VIVVGLPEIRSFRPADAGEGELVECYELARAAHVADFPGRPFQPYPAFADQMRRPEWLRGRQQIWVARGDGKIEGLAIVALPKRENRRLTITTVTVPPSLRRQGIGTALLGATLPEARADGRITVTGQGLKAGGAGASWARSLGFRQVQEFVLQALVIPDVDPGLWDVPAPAGFRAEGWTGSAPDQLIGAYAQARTAITDAPSDLSSLEFPEWTAKRVRQHEADIRERGYESRVIVAVHESSGTIAGLTEILASDSRPDHVYQQDTAVLRQFRGHGLGRFMKAAMMRWLTADQPGVTRVATNTDARNTHMIRVNQQVGYVTDYAVTDVEADLGMLETRLAVG
jgi:mycothiol synthase